MHIKSGALTFLNLAKFLLLAILTLQFAASSVASANAWKTIDWVESITDPTNLLFIIDSVANNNSTYYYDTFYVSQRNGYTSSLQAAVTMGTNYYEPTSKTNIDYVHNDFRRPEITLADGKININKNKWRYYPIWHYEKRIRNSSDSITGGGDYVVIHHGYARGAPSTIQLTTISGGVTSTLQPWFEDDDNIIAGVWNFLLRIFKRRKKTCGLHSAANRYFNRNA